MKVDRNESALTHEGGEDAGEETKRGTGSKEDRHGEKAKEFDATAHGLTKEHGMARERGCTDMLCVILFLAFISTMFGLGIYGISQGDVRRMIKPYDFSSQVCGVDDSVKGYGKLYFTKLAPDWHDAVNTRDSLKSFFYTNAVCVKECPSQGNQPIKCPTTQELNALAAASTNNTYKAQLAEWGRIYEQLCTPVLSVETSSMMDLCWPHYANLTQSQKDSWNYVTDALSQNVIWNQIMNLSIAWRALLFAMGMALVLCIVYIYFMAFFANILAWIIIALTQIAFIVLCAGSFYMWMGMADNNPAKNTALIVGIITGILALLFAVSLWCGWNSLKLAIEIVNTSADFLAATKRLLAVPLLYYVFLFLFFLFWVGCVICVESMGDIVPNPGDRIQYIPLDKDVNWGDKKLGHQVNIMLAFLTFGLIWFTFFLTASNNYVVMVTASTYYFNNDIGKEGSGEVMTGMRWAWVQNFGSLAFGSLIIAIIWTIKVLVYYVCKKAEAASGNNGFVKCLTCIAMCLIGCIEKIIDYINKAAYAFMAISGNSFCSSAYNGLLLQMKHGGTFAFGNYLASMFILLGKIGLTVLNVFLTWMFMTRISGSAARVSSPYAPLFIVAVCTFLIVSVFLGLFDESVLALMTSFTADLDLNGGTPAWGPETLQNTVMGMFNDGQEPEEKKEGDGSNKMEA